MSKLSIKALEEIKENSNNELEKDIIDTLLSKGDKEEIESYIEDLLQHGCISGIEGSLIYYIDTCKFFETFKTEINELLKESLLETGFSSPAELFGKKWDDEDPLVQDQLNQNLLAWFGFEETVRKIAYQLDMNI